MDPNLYSYVHKINTEEKLIGVEKVEIGKVLEILFVLQYELLSILLFYYFILMWNIKSYCNNL